MVGDLLVLRHDITMVGDCGSISHVSYITRGPSAVLPAYETAKSSGAALGIACDAISFLDQNPHVTAAWLIRLLPPTPRSSLLCTVS